MLENTKILCVCRDGQMSALFGPLLGQDLHQKGQPATVINACSKKEYSGAEVAREIIYCLGSVPESNLAPSDSLIKWIGDFDLREYIKVLCIDADSFADAEDLFLERDMVSKSDLVVGAARWCQKDTDPKGRDLGAYVKTAIAMTEVIRGLEGIVGETTKQTRQTPPKKHNRKISY